MDDLSVIIRRCKRNNESKLNLSSRNMTMIPPEIYQLSTSLEVLDLSFNKITQIEQKLTQLPRLTNLDLSNNKIIIVPKFLLSLNNLQTLNLSGNPLSSQFEIMLDKENQSAPQLYKALESCYENGGISVQQNQGRLQNNLQLKNIKSKQEMTSFDSFDQDYVNQNQSQPSLGVPVEKIQSSFNQTSMGFTFKRKEDENQKPTWFEDPTSINNNPQMINQMKDVEKLLKQEQQKVVELQKELELYKNNQLINQVKNDAKLFKINEYLQNALEIQFSELLVEETISQGGFSIVHRGEFRGTEVAIKKIFDPNITDELMDDLSNEISFLSRLRHQNIVLLMGIVSKPPNLCIVTEYLPCGSLFNLLHKSKKEIRPQIKLKMIMQIAKALNFLHQSFVIHRDIKSHNILFDENFIIKLCDFGIARYQNDLNIGDKKFCGTPNYMAPELFQKKQYDSKIDVFAFGTLMWEIITRQIPYEGLDPSDISHKVIKEEPLQYTEIDPNLVKIIKECRAKDPKNRPTFKQIVEQLENL